jgi:TPR repeat protein
MGRKTALAVTVWVLAALSAAVASAQDFDAGLSAYNAADYQAAIRNWRPLAEGDDPKAQAALAFLYFKGLGMARDGQRAAYWYRRAAEQGQPEAQFFLGTLYFLGNGVPQDYVRAHMWCEVALARGIPQGLDCRDAASRAMTPGQVREAFDRAAEWLRHFARKRR